MSAIIEDKGTMNLLILIVAEWHFDFLCSVSECIGELME